MKEGHLANFDPLLLTVTQYGNGEGAIVDNALEVLAKKAMELGCKYVTHIQPVGYNGITPKAKYGSFFLGSGVLESDEQWKQALHLVATGLKPKDQSSSPSPSH